MLLSLYCGCGGLDLGFERAGFSIGLAYDINHHAIATWNRNRPDAPCGHVSDLSTIRFNHMDRDHGSQFTPTGVIGGPPCQSFSRANHFRSDKDARRNHVRNFFSIALRFHRHRRDLDFILMENVPDLGNAEDGKLLERETMRLERYHFHVYQFFLDAVHYTVPQRRRRLFILAIPISKLTNTWSPPKKEDTTTTVRDAIQDLPPPTHFRRGLQPDDTPFHPNHWCMKPLSPKFSDGYLVEGSSSGRSFKTLTWDRPSITVSYGHREVHIHPDGERRLSVLEAMRLQGIPDDYVLTGTLSAQINQVSEAVPPPLAEAIALTVSAATT